MINELKLMNTTGIEISSKETITKDRVIGIIMAIWFSIVCGGLMIAEVKRKTNEKTGNIQSMGYVFSTPIAFDEAKAVFDKKYANDDKMYLVNEKLVNEDMLQVICEQLGWKDEFEKFKKAQLLIKNESFEKKAREQLEKLLKSISIISDLKGHVLLAMDKEYNSVWSYLTRSKKWGTVTYHIYLRKANGNISNSVLINPNDVATQGAKIFRILNNFEANFTEVEMLKASQILWIVNNVKDYSRLEDDWDDYAVDEVGREAIKWMIENIGKTFRKKSYDPKSEFEPVYCEKVNGERRLGIWAKDIEFVFQELDMGVDYSTWKSEAVNHGLIKRDKSRLQTNVTEKARNEYKREDKNERVLLFNLTEADVAEIEAKISEDNGGDCA